MYAIVGWLLSAQVSKVVAYLAAITILTGTLIAVISAALSQIAVNMPADALAFSAAILPSNLDACIAVIISVRVARWVYDKNMKVADKLSE